jgi:hypothetical protein
MPIRERNSGWSGRARRAAWSLALSAALAGCASWSERLTAVDHVDFLVQALESDGRGREQLWRDYASGDGSDDAQLRAALLQSLPDHSGYDPIQARSRLDALAVKRPGSVNVASVARLRLAQMHGDGDCRREVSELKQRLARVVDIERRLNQK